MGKVDVKICQGLNLNCVAEGVYRWRNVLISKVIDRYCLSVRIHYPVFFDAIYCIKVKFCQVISAGSARANDFNNPSRSSYTALFRDLIPITDNH